LSSTPVTPGIWQNAPESVQQVVAEYDFQSEDTRIHSFKAGDVFRVTAEEGGWLVALDSLGVPGYLPPDYVKPL
jgi:hypothetical protein